MPTSTEEAANIYSIVNEYLPEDDAKELMGRLDSEVGQKSDNESLQISLQMLSSLYNTVERKPNKLLFLLLLFVIVAHMFVVVINTVAFFILPFTYPLHIWVPLDSFILTVMFSRQICPLTALENYLRKKVGWKCIGGFVGHYFWKPFKLRFFNEK